MNLFILVFMSIGASIGSLLYIFSACKNTIYNFTNYFSNNSVPLINGGSSGESKAKILDNKPQPTDPTKQNQVSESLQPAYMTGQTESNLNVGVTNIPETTNIRMQNADEDVLIPDSVDDPQNVGGFERRRIGGYIMNQSGKFSQSIKGNNLVINQSDSQVANIIANDRNIQESIPLGGNIFAGGELGQGEFGNNVQSLGSIIRGGRGHLNLDGYTPTSRGRYTGKKLAMLVDPENGNVGIREAIAIYSIYKTLSGTQNELLGEGQGQDNYAEMMKQPEFGRMVRTLVALNPNIGPAGIESVLFLSAQMYAGKNNHRRKRFNTANKTCKYCFC